MSVQRKDFLQLAHVPAKSNRRGLRPDSYTAVCVVGAARTFTDPMLRSSWESKFHRDGYEYFFSVDDLVLNTEQFPPRSVVRRVTLIPEVDVRVPDERECYSNHTKMHFYMLPYILRMVECANMIESAELVSGRRYQYVARLRPDLLFFENFPQIKNLVQLYEEEYSGRAVVLFDDQMAFARRIDMDNIFRHPRLAYQCHNADEWAKACNVSSSREPEAYEALRRKIEKPNREVPCPPMNLIALYATKVAADDQREDTVPAVKQCGYVWDAGCTRKSRCHIDVLRPDGKTRQGCIT